MDTKQKELYDSPTIIVVEIKHEGVICGSPNYTGFGYEEGM